MDDTEFYKEVYYRADRCLSSAIIAEKAVASGWVMDLVMSTNQYAYNMKKLPQHITEVPFELEGNDEELYFWRSGVFSSHYEDEEKKVLVPQFSHMVTKKKK